MGTTKSAINMNCTRKPIHITNEQAFADQMILTDVFILRSLPVDVILWSVICLSVMPIGLELM